MRSRNQEVFGCCFGSPPFSPVFWWRSISYNRKVCTFQSLFPLLCLSCTYADFLSLSQIVEFAITKNWVQYRTVPRFYIWLIACFLRNYSWVNEFHWSELYYYSNLIYLSFSWFDMGSIRKPVAHQFLSKKQAHHFPPLSLCWFDQSVKVELDFRFSVVIPFITEIDRSVESLIPFQKSFEVRILFFCEMRRN